jgi:PKD repeat protein
MRSFYFPLFVLLTLSINVLGQTNVPSVITGNQIWTQAGSPYIIGQNTYIDTNASVTIQPGVKVDGKGYSLIIDGELQALGTSDSMIEIENLEFQFKSGSVDYDPTTGKGAFFKYCDITAKPSLGTRCFMMNNTSMRLESCQIAVGYYGIYKTGSSSFDSSLIEIDSCEFIHQNPGNGYSIYHTGGDLHVHNSTFSGGRTLYLSGEFIFNKNAVYNFQQVQLNARSNVEFRCNQLTKVSNGIRISTYSNSAGNFTFEDNTLDSFGSASLPQTYPMVDFYRPLTNSSMQFSFRRNNFLKYTGTLAKLDITGSNQSPGSYTLLDFKRNFWDTKDTVKIKNMIHDYEDDITIYGKVDYTDYLDSQSVGCHIKPPCGMASFTYEIKGDTVKFTNKSTGNGAVKWSFGDGHTSTDHNPVHVYGKNDKYAVCMTLYDTDSTACDEYCDTLEIKSASCQASFYVGLDSSHIFNLFIVNNSKGTTNNTTYSWDFGDGSTSQKKNPTHQYGSFGLYQLCLTIKEGNCTSTYCDSIGLDSLGNLLKMEGGFTISVIDESDLLSLPTEKDRSISVYPNPSNGNFSFRLGDESKIQSFQVFSMNGTEIPFTYQPSSLGNWNARSVNTPLTSGLYTILIKTHSGHYRSTILIQ